MAKTAGIDQAALIDMFSQASAKQSEALRSAVSTATLRALQGRELTLANMRSVLKTVTQATSAGAAQNTGSGVDVEVLLGSAFSGMDSAMQQAVEANRRALQQFVDQGMGLQEGRLKTALAEIEKMEDTLFATVGKAVQGAGAPLQGPWTKVLESMKMQGTDTGSQANAAVEQLMSQAQGALRETRAMSLRAAQAMMDSYAALVSGVLIGMSEALQQGSTEPPEARAAAKTKR